MGFYWLFSTMAVAPKTNKSIPPPKSLQLEGNIATNWRHFKRDWSNYEIATGLDEGPERIRIATLLSCIGREAMNIYDGFVFDSETPSLTDIIKEFETFCIGKTNECYERFIFNSRQQETDEPFDKYLSELRKLVKTCQYGQLEDDLLRDRILIGIRCAETRRRLLQTHDLNLEKTIAICRTNETAATQIKTMYAEHKVNKVHARGNPQQTGKYVTPKGQRRNLNTPHRQERRDHWIADCRYCGQSHPRQKEKCPAYNKTCKRCHKKNHFQSKCLAKAFFVNQESESEETEEDEKFVLKVGNAKSLTANMRINKKKVAFQLDSGADVNTLNRKFVFTQQMKPSTKKLIMWNGEKLEPLGEATLTTLNPKTGQDFKVTYQIVDNHYVNLLGLRTIQDMDLIKIRTENIAKVTAETEKPTIGDLGTATLQIRDDVSPRALSCRRIPLALKSKVKEQLDTLVSRGILDPVSKPTAWVSQMAIVEKKNGDIRLCIDPQLLNKALMREHYQLPTLDDILPQLQKAKVFSKFDVKEAFYHVKLDEQSSDLTTMITPYGRYRWRRLPFGLCVSSEVFQRRLNEALEGLPGCINVADDIIIFGSNESEHDDNVRKLKQRCENRCIILNDEKALTKLKQIEFLGHVINAEGIRPDPEKIRAITEMTKPTDVPGVRRFCGLVQYLSRFLPHLSRTVDPLRALTRKNALFQWSQACQIAFDEVKSKVAKATSLTFFDRNKPLSLQVDSSSEGLGAVLLQDGKPIEFASRSLTATQKKWAQIEKETLAVVFGLERFHQYTYGRQVCIENDHKPLENIFQKPLSQAPKRIQNLVMRTHKYDFKFIFVPGTELKLADALSRAHLDETEDIEENFINFVQIRDVILEKLRVESNSDESYRMLKTFVLHGWPENKNDMPHDLRPYFPMRDCITVSDGLLMKGERAIIPKSMRHEIKARIHSSHLGHDAMVRRARDTVYWPGLNAELKQIVDTCDACQKHKPQNRREPLIQHDEGKYPWEKVGIDFMEFQSKTYMIYVDYFSNFIEVDNMTTTTTSQVILKLKQQFARYGIPKVIITDCGPQFTAAHFGEFMQKWNIVHKTSSPGHHQSNGKAESAVKTIKRLMKKSIHAESDPYQGLLEIRNTPRQDINVSPAQLVFGRQTRSFLPANNKMTNISPSDIRIKRKRRQDAIKRHYDKHTQPLPKIDHQGQKVYFRSEGHNFWKKGRIMPGNNEHITVPGNNDHERSYIIAGDNEGRYRRNRRHINVDPNDKPEPNVMVAPSTAPQNAPRPTSVTQEPPNRSDNVVIPSPDQHVDTTTNKHMVTRSGRISKPPNKMNL